VISGGRWRKVEDLFATAFDLGPKERTAFLAIECAGDDALRAEVESLLAVTSKADSIFERRTHLMEPIATALRSELLLDSNLGSYHIEAALGEGGMGIVYHATDMRDGTPAALKVLPPEMVDDPGRRHRFALEARATSALDHPGIVKIFEIGHSEFGDFIAMEYIQGQSLQSLLGRPLALRDVLSFAAQISSALACAHAAGIVHRDIKPANILVASDGIVKVVDFGLCKLTESGGAQTDSRQSWTREGNIVGTTAYMSPEQAEGKRGDCRSDVFSLGSVLYEMVTGARPFQGDTQISTLASILRSQPRSICEVVPNVARAVEVVILRCLEKDPARRYQSADHLNSALKDLSRRLAEGKLRCPLIPRKYRSRAYAAGAFCVLLPFAAWFLRMERTTSAGGALVQLTFDSGLTTDPALSLDGHWLAYASDRAGANLSIWLQKMPKGNAVRLTWDDADHSEPSVSPDGSVVVFRAEHDGGGVYAVSTHGGQEKAIAKDGRRPRFSPDGKWIAYWTGGEGSGDPDAAGGSQVFVVPAAGGEPRQIQPGYPSARSPDSRHLLFVGCNESAETPGLNSSWWMAPIDGGPAVQSASPAVFRQASLLDTLTPGAWLPDRIIASYYESDQLWQVPVSLESHKTTGGAQRISMGLDFQASPSTALDGRIAFSSVVSTRTNLWSLPISADSGRVEGEPVRISAVSGRAMLPAQSSDGRWLTYAVQGHEGPGLWKQDLQTNHRDWIIPATNWSTFLPDGKHIAYVAMPSNRASLFVMPREGGAAKMIAENVDKVWDLSPDAQSVLVFSGSGQPRRVALLDIPSGRSIDLLQHPRWNLYLAHFSSDGRWILFDAKTGPDRSRIFIAPFSGVSPIPQDRWIAVTDGSAMDSHAWWAPGGRRLYFFSERDGHRCLWTQALNGETKTPLGAAAPVYHFHRAALSPRNVNRGVLSLSVALDKIVLPLGEKTGNIWLK
jgi:Tol biopolymer transport system component/predicted Ser/Thr protein kinase